MGLNLGVKIWGDVKGLIDGLKSGEKSLKDFEQVSATSMKQVQGTLKALEKAYFDVASSQGANSKAAANLKAAYSQLENQSKELKTSLKGVAKTKDDFGDLQGAFTGLLAKFSAVGLGAGALVKVFDGVIDSTDATKDAWEEMTTGIQFGWNAVLRSMATGDFSNFMTRMTEAIKAGEEYARTLDDLEKRTRSVSIRESELNLLIDQERLALKNVNLTAKERQAHIDKLVKLEKGLADEKRSNAQTLFNQELKNAKLETGLSEYIIKNYIKQYSAYSPLIQQAEEYNKALKDKAMYSKMANEAQGGFIDVNAQNLAGEAQKKIDSTPQNVKNFAHIVELMGRLSDATGKKLETAWVAVNNATHEYNQSVERALTTNEKLAKSEDKASEKQINNLKKQKTALEDYIDYQKDLSSGKVTNYPPTPNAYEFNEGRAYTPIDKVQSRPGLVSIPSGPTPAIMPVETTSALQQAMTGISSAMDQIGGKLGGLYSKFANVFKGISDVVNASADKTKDKWKTVFQAIGEVVLQIMGIISSIIQQSYDQRIQAVDTYYSNEKEKIQNSTLTEQEKSKRIEKLDKDQEKKRKELMRQQAKDQKTVSIIQAIIAGALAVVTALGAGPVLGIVLAGIVGALAAVQIAMIVSQPLPALAGGGLAYGPTTALIGEYPNASVNPEVITPLDKLKGMLFGEGGGVLTARVAGSDLLFILDQATDNRTRVRGY